MDSNTKEFSVSDWERVASFERIAVEVEKCVLLCANCHQEVHAGCLSIDPGVRRFDRDTFNALRQEAVTQRRQKASKERSTLSRKRGSWDGVDVIQLRSQGMNWCSIGRLAGVSNMAARKRYAKLMGT